MVRGRPKKYTEIERYILNRCHVKIVQDVFKKCVFGQTYPAIKTLMKIHKIKLSKEKNKKKRQIHRTIIKYIWIYIQHTDFITIYQREQEKHGYENEHDRYGKEKVRDDYLENREWDDDTTDLEENEDGYDVDDLDVEVLGERNPEKEYKSKQKKSINQNNI